MTDRSGVLLRTDSGLRFVASSIAERVVHLGPTTPIAGLPQQLVGVALAEGRVVTLVRVGPGGARLGVLCDVDGDPIVLVGAEVEAIGAFEAADGGVTYGDEIAAELDVRAVYEEIEGALWASRALRHARRRAEARASERPPPMPDDGGAR